MKTIISNAILHITFLYWKIFTVAINKIFIMLYNKWMLNIFFLQTLKSTWKRIKNSRRVVVHVPSLGYTEEIRAQMYNFHVEQNNQIARICSISGKVILYLCFRALIQCLTFNNAITRNICTCAFVLFMTAFFRQLNFIVFIDILFHQTPTSMWFTYLRSLWPMKQSNTTRSCFLSRKPLTAGIWTTLRTWTRELLSLFLKLFPSLV